MANYAVMNPGSYHLGYVFNEPPAIGSYSDENAPSGAVKFKTAVVLNRQVYIGNVQVTQKNDRSRNYGDRIMKSTVAQFDNFPLFRTVDIALGDGDSIVRLEEYAERLLVYKQKSLYIVNASSDLEFLESTHSFMGVESHAAVCKTDQGVAWVNQYGVFMYNGNRIFNLLEKNGVRIISESSWSDFYENDAMIGFAPKYKQLIVFDSATGSTSAGDIYVYDLVTQSWVFGSAAVSAGNKTNPIVDYNGDLVFAHSSGTVVKWTDTPSGATSNFELITKEEDFNTPSLRKKIYKVIITYTGGGSQSVDVTYGVNGASPTSQFDANLDNTSGNTIVAELTPSSAITDAKSLQLKFSGTIATTFKLHDISIIYRLKKATI